MGIGVWDGRLMLCGGQNTAVMGGECWGWGGGCKQDIDTGSEWRGCSICSECDFIG